MFARAIGDSMIWARSLGQGVEIRLGPIAYAPAADVLVAVGIDIPVASQLVEELTRMFGGRVGA